MPCPVGSAKLFPRSLASRQPRTASPTHLLAASNMSALQALKRVATAVPKGARSFQSSSARLGGHADEPVGDHIASPLHADVCVPGRGSCSEPPGRAVRAQSEGSLCPLALQAYIHAKHMYNITEVRRCSS